MNQLSKINLYNINTNLLQTTKFYMVFEKLPHISYFCQTCILPSITVADVQQPSPLSTIYRHGDHLEYDVLTLTFLIDEELMTWKETFNWMEGLTFPKEYAQYKKQKSEGLYSDGILTILNNSQEDAMRIKFYNCFPSNLGPINLTYTASAEEALSTDLMIRYDRMEFIPLT